MDAAPYEKDARMPPLLGLLLLLCGRDCALPLPGHVLEVEVRTAQWHWCLRADDGGQRICADEWAPRLQEWVDGLRRAFDGPATTASGTRAGHARARGT